MQNSLNKSLLSQTTALIRAKQEQKHVLSIAYETFSQNVQIKEKKITA